eukprot:GAHX01001983.1.p1 GENE.GAHX01001983.1~~GAHX01001983.1.p1  ORF type:complete len:243 (+),score=41.90 GAHX01001983.1:310-1038(+)
MFFLISLSYILIVSTFSIRYPKPTSSGFVRNHRFSTNKRFNPKQKVKKLQNLTTTALSDNVCNALADGINPVRLVPTGDWVIDTANKHPTPFKRTWNHILKRIDNEQLDIQLAIATGDNLDLFQYDGASGLQKLARFFTGEFAWGTVMGELTAGVNACLLEVRGTEVEASLDQIFEGFNAGSANWFFCPRPVIRILFNPIEQPSNDRKWSLKIYFEDICVPAGTPVSTDDVLNVTGQLYDAV